MHELIAAPFLGEYFLLRPGAVNGVKLPRARAIASHGRMHRLDGALP